MGAGVRRECPHWAMPPVRPVQGLIANPAVTLGNREPGFGTSRDRDGGRGADRLRRR